MKKEMFKPYQQFLRRIISSAETQDHLLICLNMIDNFLLCFRGSVSFYELNEVNSELMDALQAKQESITIIEKA